MFFDPVYLIIVAPGMLLAFWASFRVKSTFREFSQVSTRSGLTGAQVAQQIIRGSSIRDVRVEPHEGFMSDHYDPSERVVRLSPDVYNGRSVSAVGVAAHECGHVLQDAQSYAPMRVRQSLVGPANFGSSAAFIIMVAGFFLHLSGLVWLGIIGFSLVVLFQLVTLPVEFNASSRARAVLLQSGIVAPDEERYVGRVLNAAALTYIAALITAVLQLVYFLVRFGGVGRDD